MTRKRISSSNDDFVIPLDSTLKISKEVRVKLAPGKAKKYDVWQKDILTGAPLEYNGQEIHWVNCFGLKLRKDKAESSEADKFEGEGVDEYDFEIDAEAGKTYLFYDGKKLGVMTLEGGKAHAKLANGDPAIGYSP